jgi:predicted NBD/HSP70 family sugar kinase
VETSIYNDIKLACIAEKKAGTIPSNINDVLYIHIGETSGTAMMINGKIYNGANGFSGEISIYNNVDELSSTTRTNKLYSLWRTKSRILEAKKSNETLNDGDELDINEIVQDYLRGDKETAEIIEESAKYNAISIIGYADLLDVEYVVVGGDITKFGENYRELLLHYVNLYDAREFRPRLVFSSLGEDACLKGAIYQVKNNFFVNLFKKMSKLEMDSLELSESSVLNQ